MKRNLDGVYFRVKRGDRYESICFTDLTPDEAKMIMEDKSDEWLNSLCEILFEVLYEMLKLIPDYKFTSIVEEIAEAAKEVGIYYRVHTIRSAIISIGELYDIVGGEENEE